MDKLNNILMKHWLESYFLFSKHQYYLHCHFSSLFLFLFSFNERPCSLSSDLTILLTNSSGIGIAREVQNVQFSKFVPILSTQLIGTIQTLP